MNELLKTARLKLAKFLLDPKVENLLTLEEYSVLEAYQKGYASYLQSSWDESEIGEQNPYKEGTGDFEQFKQGSFAAMQEVQETQE